jgi:hypothetical protein
MVLPQLLYEFLDVGGTGGFCTGLGRDEVGSNQFARASI